MAYHPQTLLAPVEGGVFSFESGDPPGHMDPAELSDFEKVKGVIRDQATKLDQAADAAEALDREADDFIERRRYVVNALLDVEAYLRNVTSRL